MPFNDQDEKYIAKKLGLPTKIISKISETERDSHLLLSEVSVKNIKKADLDKITALTYIKLVVFRYSYDTGFDIDEKLYIAKSIYFLFPEIKKGLNSKLITSKGHSEEKSRYFLVLAGLFYEILPENFFFHGYLDFIAEGFRSKNYNLSKNVQEWQYVLREIHRKGWFLPINKPKPKPEIKPRLLLTN